MDLVEFREKMQGIKGITTEKLVERLIESLLSAPELKTLVVHQSPDFDACLCLFLARKFVKGADKTQIAFVKSGTALQDSENNPSVVHFDTGGGDYDQHSCDRNRRKLSSSYFFAEKMNLLNDPGVKFLVDKATEIDNIEGQAPDSFHWLIKGLKSLSSCKNSDGKTIDWSKVLEKTFEVFEIYYQKENIHMKGRESYRDHSEILILPNGLRVVSVLWHPEARDEAFSQGGDVVIWTQSKGKTVFYTGIAVNKKLHDKLFLSNVVAILRTQEGKIRGADISSLNLKEAGPKMILGWYLDKSLHLVLNGSHTHPLTQEEMTRLMPRQIVGLVHKALAAVPPQVVANWRASSSKTS